MSNTTDARASISPERACSKVLPHGRLCNRTSQVQITWLAGGEIVRLGHTPTCRQVVRKRASE